MEALRRADQPVPNRDLRGALQAFGTSGVFSPPDGTFGTTVPVQGAPVVRSIDEAQREDQSGRWDAVVVVDDSPSMWAWSEVVRDFEHAVTTAGVFRDVLIRRLGLDESSELVLWGQGAASVCRGVGEVLDPSNRRVIFVLTDGAHAMWRSGAVWGPLRLWGSNHPMTLVSLVPWTVANRMGGGLHRLQLRGDGRGVPNSRLRWRPQVDVPGVFDDLGDVMPVCFAQLDAEDLGRWSRLVVGGAGWTDLGAMLVPAESGPQGVVQGDPRDLVAAYRTNATPEAFRLAVLAAAAPLEVELLSWIRERMVRGAGAEVMSEFLGSPLVEALQTPPSTPRGRATYKFGIAGVREELLGFGRRRETAEVRRIVHAYLTEREPEVLFFDSPLDEERDLAGLVTGLSVSGIEQMLDAARAGELALSGRHLRNYWSITTEVAGVFPSRGGHSSENHSDHPTVAVETAHVLSPPIGEQPLAGLPAAQNPFGEGEGVEVTSTVDRENEEGRTALTSPVFGGVPPRNLNFTGRVDLLQELERRLVRGATAAVLPEALHGMGGVGKSQLAIEYAYRNRDKFDLIWWIPAERSVKVVNSLVELGERLNLNVGAEANVAVQQVLDALRSGTHRKVPKNWLLVFDNADSPAAVQQYLPSGGTGRILVTSRNSQWLSVARPLEVDVFRRAESTQLLRRRDPDLTEEDASRLAEALGDLPLAVAQAAAWRVETGMLAQEYLDLLEEKQAELLDVTTALDYPRSVAAMWNLSLNQLKRKNPSAVRLLQACAFLAPESIARSMFTNSRNIDVTPEFGRVLRDRLKLNEAIRDINRFALVRIDHRTNSIEMHRLVQTVLISQMTDEERDEMRHAAHLILAANDPDAPDESDQWPKYADLSAHLAASNAYECQDDAVRNLAFNQAVFLYRWGEHDQAVELSGRLYKIWHSALGADHADTLKLGRWYGFMLWTVGRYRESGALDHDLLRLHREKYGEAHEETIEAIGSVAGDNRANGNFDGALELSIRNYENCVRYLGDNDPVTLNAAHNLAVSYRLVGRFQAARELDEDTLDRKVQIFGQDHPTSLITDAGLSVDLRELGNYHDARTQLETIVQTHERIGRPLDPTMLRAMRQLEIARRKAGDHDGALKASEMVLSGLNTRYGADHPETLAAAVGQSIELRHAGRFARAMQLGQDSLTRYAKTLGPDHPHTLAAAVNVAILRRSVGEAEGARDMDRATYDKFKEQLGVDHPSTLVTAVNLASDLWVLGNAQAAFDLDTDTLRRAIEVLGTDHPTTLACKANLVRDMLALGRAEEAERLQRETIEAWRVKLGADHPAVSQFVDMDVRANCDLDPLPL